jgi:hypothetical protein
MPQRLYKSIRQGLNCPRSILVPRIIIAAAAILASGLAFASSVSAQETGQQGGERVNQLIVYGNDPCPQSAGDEITVCARKDEGERYRIPEVLRGTKTPDGDAWNNRVIAYETVGKTGTLSCSPVGAGGSTGCLSKLIDAAYAEKKSDPSVRFSELIAAEREKRLSTVDQEAKETQQRVEEAEKQYIEREKREQEAQKPEATSPQGK